MKKMTQKAHNFTSAQLEAIHSDKKLIVVSAGAGSGKTSVLTERYVELLKKRLQEGGSPNNIIALTYTEKAANEMRERILQRFHNDRGLRSEILSAPIGTIHSFCSNLVHKFSFYLGIDPKYRVLDTAEANEIKEKALKKAIISAGRNDKEGAKVFDFVTKLEQDKVTTWLYEAYEDAIKMGITPADMKLMMPLPDEKTAQLKDDFLRIIFEEFDSDIWTAKAAEKTKEVVRVVRESDLLRLSNEETVELLKSLPEIMKGMQTRGEAKELKERMDIARKELIGACIDQITFSDLCVAHKILLAYHNEYTKLKGEIAAIDYNDMLFFARELLTNFEEVREYIAATHTHILVDESQDLSPLQHKIVEELSYGLPIFFVGDIKQAIFRFQGSDIKCMQRLESTAKESEEGSRISLMDNFRSQSSVLCGINGFFSHLWERCEDAAKDGFIYEPLIAGKGEDEEKKCSTEIYFLSKKDEFTPESEAGFIAKKILELKNEEGYSFGDIMLILPKLTKVKMFEDALNSAAIPYSITGRKGFYLQQEILILSYLLAFIVNPFDDLAVVSLLMSEYIGCSPSELWHIKRGNRRCSIYERLQRIENIENISEKTRQNIVKLLEFTHDIQNRHHLDLPQVIDILTTDIRVKIAKSLGILGRQNLIKIARKAEIAHAKMNMDIYGFLSFLESQRHANDKEPFAATSGADDNDKVRITSIHSSKGLESKVVFFGFTGSKHNDYINKFIVSADGDLAYMGDDPDKYSSLNFEKLKTMEEAILKFERERLMYVAMTRAKERLIISGARGSKSQNDYLNDISMHLTGTKDGALSLDSEISFYGNTLKIMSLDEIKAVLDADFTNNENFSMSLERKEIDKEKYTNIVDTVDTRLKIEDIEKFERIGVSNLLKLHECPQCYYLSTNYAVNEEKREEELPEFNENLALGTHFHAFMERANLNEDLTGEQFSAYAKQYELEDVLREKLKKRLTEFSLKPIFDEILAADRVYRELKFVYRFQKMEISGCMDMLLEKNGKLKIIDYKLGKKSKNHELQILLYSLSVENIFGGEILYLNDEGITTEKVIATMENLGEVQNIILEAQKCILTEDFPAKECNLCKYCKKCDLF